MADRPLPIPEPPQATASEVPSGRVVDNAQSRIFPCEQCGADLVFHIGEQQQRCEFCGYVRQIEVPKQGVEEQDFESMLQKLQSLRQQGKGQTSAGTQEVTCSSCAGTIVFTESLTSSACPYCGTPVQREKIHDSPERIPVDGLIPFKVPEKKATENLKSWVRSLWFAPSDFQRLGVHSNFNGVYLPFFTYDAATASWYSGERGDHYWVDVVKDKQTVKERRTRWSSASGNFDRFFDDLLILAATGQKKSYVDALAPWPLAELVPFNQEMLSGFLARTYDVSLQQGFEQARAIIKAACHAEARRRIGGDEQRVERVDTTYHAITYKHLLLPVWLLTFTYKDKVYNVFVNAVTGEVQGERPWSFWKLILLVLIIVGVVLGVAGIVALVGAIGGH